MRYAFFIMALMCLQVSAQEVIQTRTLYPKPEQLRDFQNTLWSQVPENDFRTHTYGHNNLFHQYVVTTGKSTMDQLKAFCGEEATYAEFVPSKEAFSPFLAKVLALESKKILSVSEIIKKENQRVVRIWATPKTQAGLEKYLKLCTNVRVEIDLNTKETASAVQKKMSNLGIALDSWEGYGQKLPDGGFLYVKIVVSTLPKNIKQIQAVAEKYNNQKN